MRFVTRSGAKYELAEVEGVEVITRDAEAPIHGLSREEAATIHAARVSYVRPPTVGERFHYTTPLGPISSSIVESVEP